MSTIDGPIALRTLASGQSGLFSLDQAATVGVSQRTIERWTAQGRIETVRRRVHAFAGVPPSRWRPAVAAALAAGEHAVLSHRTAAAVHHFSGLALPCEPELTLPGDRRSRLQGVVSHYTGPVPAREMMIRRGVAVTTPARTLVDLASSVTPELLGSILDEGAVKRQWTFEEVLDCLGRQPRRREGGQTLRRLLAFRLGEPTPDSALEQQIIRYLTPLGPFAVHHQIILDGTIIILDVAWPWWRVAAEIDGRSYRQISRSAHDRESRKLTLLAAHDWKVAHLTATMTASECVEAVLSLTPGGTQLSGAPHKFRFAT